MPKETVLSEQEKVPIVERPTTPEISPEVEYIRTTMGAEITLPQPITDDTGQIIVGAAAPQKVEIKLPLSEEQILQGLGYKIIDSFRWLAEWCKRLIKIMGGKFSYITK